MAQQPSQLLSPTISLSPFKKSLSGLKDCPLFFIQFIKKITLEMWFLLKFLSTTYEYFNVYTSGHSEQSFDYNCLMNVILNRL